MSPAKKKTFLVNILLFIKQQSSTTDYFVIFIKKFRERERGGGVEGYIYMKYLK